MLDEIMRGSDAGLVTWLDPLIPDRKADCSLGMTVESYT